MHAPRCIDEPEDRMLLIGCIYTRYATQATEELIKQEALLRVKVHANPKFLHTLNGATKIMTEDFAEYLIDLRRAGLTS